MDRTQKLTAVSLASLAVVVALLKWRGHPSVQEVPPAGVDPFMAPYGWATPGISDDAFTLNGGQAPFQSTVNVTVNPSYLGTLSQTFIPLFGFVGMAVDPSQQGGAGVATQAATPGGQPTRVVAPPPAPSSFVSSQPIAAPSQFTQPLPIAANQSALVARNVNSGGSGMLNLGGIQTTQMAA